MVAPHPEERGTRVSKDEAASRACMVRDAAVAAPHHEVRESPLTFGSVFPVLPLYVMDFQVAGNGCADGWEKAILAKLRQ
ncbi:hypothetical protein V1292_001351 [Bradyrhizobium sp. AZCC 1719]